MSKESSDGFRTNSDYDMYAVNSKFRVNISKDIHADFTIDYNHKYSVLRALLHGQLLLLIKQMKRSLPDHLNSKKESVLKLYSHNSENHLYPNPGSEDNTHRNHVNGLELQHSLSIGSSNLLTGGIELLEEDVDSRDDINSANSIGRHSRTRKGIFIQNETSLSEKAILTIGTRYDDISSQERFSPKASFLIKLPYQINISLSAGKGFRVPAMNALYWPDTGWAVGNPDLKPEQSTEYEIVIQKFFGNTGNIKLVTFEKNSKNLIQWQEVSPGRWSPVNISRARITGVETEGRLRISAADIGLNYTFLDPEDRATGEKIRFTSRHQIKGTASVYPAKGTTISFEWGYVSNYVVQEGDPRCYFLLDGKISQKVKLSFGTAEVFIIGKNILDRDFQTVKGYPMPPVQFIGGINFSF